MCGGTTSRIASNTSSGKRRRLASEPPYSSSRLLDERRQEFVQQVAVRAVDFDRIEPQAHGAFGGLAERGLHPRETGLVERARRFGARLKRNCGRRVRDPAAVGDLDLRAAFPRHAMRGLAAGMRQLDADRHRRVRAHLLEHAGEAALVVVGPEPEIARRDAPVGFDRRSPRSPAGRRRTAPGGRDGWCASRWRCRPARRVLAHRGDDDAVGKFQAFELDGIEEMHRHWKVRPVVFELRVR